jgi:ubiquinone/menaquinone biosynthesis C-methylase UbiE
MKLLNRYMPTMEILGLSGAYQFASWASASQYLKAYSLVERHFDQNEPVLDWGTGEGHFTRHLAQEQFDVTPFTLEEEAQFAKVVGQTTASRLVLGTDPVTLPFEDASFGSATSIGVLEHVRETGGEELQSLRELHRVLKPGGKLLVYHLPNRYSWIEWIAKQRPQKHHHSFRYTKSSIETLTRAAGFKTVHHERYGVIPRLSLRTLPNKENLVSLINAFDAIASKALRAIAQNHVLVLEKI